MDGIDHFSQLQEVDAPSPFESHLIGLRQQTFRAQLISDILLPVVSNCTDIDFQEVQTAQQQYWTKS